MNKAELKALIKGRKQVYVLFYCYNGKDIQFFSGGKFFAPDEESELCGNVICNCTGEELPEDRVIKEFENQLTKGGIL